jgi:hypothetical protein
MNFFSKSKHLQESLLLIIMARRKTTKQQLFLVEKKSLQKLINKFKIRKKITNKKETKQYEL